MSRILVLLVLVLLAGCTSTAPATFPLTFGRYGGVAGHFETVIVQDSGEVEVRAGQTTTQCALSADARQQLTSALKGARWTNRSPQVPPNTADNMQSIVKDSVGRYLTAYPENEALWDFRLKLLDDVIGSGARHQLCT